MIDSRAYPVQVRPLSDEEGGGFLASVLDLAGCMGDGETEAEAIEDARTAILAWIEAATAFGDPVPEPSELEQYSGKFVARIPRSLHMKLAELAKREGVSLNQLVMYSLAQTVGEKETQKAA